MWLFNILFYRMKFLQNHVIGYKNDLTVLWCFVELSLPWDFFGCCYFAWFFLFISFFFFFPPKNDKSGLIIWQKILSSWLTLWNDYNCSLEGGWIHTKWIFLVRQIWNIDQLQVPNDESKSGISYVSSSKI